ncbi:MAG TPA: AraC family ligand binding domain-containing protein [Candidatus Nitrosotenuis sp.]|nr:AraC family ligand binding domain-containing protein [Candidatus Nitrosotenuis sp.]
MQQYKKFIKKGVSEPLRKVPFHGNAPIRRLSMLSKKLVPKSNTHVAVHFVDSKKKIPQYSFLHKHDCDEINLILSETGKLTYKIQLGDETYRVSSPSTVFIPKGVRHSANVESGKGIFVCIILSDDYKTK